MEYYGEKWQKRENFGFGESLSCSEQSLLSSIRNCTGRQLN